MPWRRIGGGCAAIALLAGCVSLADWESVQRRADDAKKINDDLARKTRQLERDYEDLKAQGRTYADLKSDTDQKDRKIAELSALLREAANRGMDVYHWDQAQAGGFPINLETGGIDLGDVVTFQSGQAVVREQMKPRIRELAKAIREKDPEGRYLIYVDGYTDRQPVKVTEKENIDNWFLGCRRAHAVMRFLREDKACDFPQERFVLNSWGYLNEIEPKAVKSERNRRVEIRLLRRSPLSVAGGARE